MAKLEGFRAKVRINNVVYAVSRWSIRDTCIDLDTSDSESGEKETRIPGMGVAEITLENASFDFAQNPFAAPINLRSRQFVDVKIFPDGLANPPHHFPSVLVLNGEHRGEAKALQPVTVTGKSNGDYTLAA